MRATPCNGAPVPPVTRAYESRPRTKPAGLERWHSRRPCSWWGRIHIRTHNRGKSPLSVASYPLDESSRPSHDVADSRAADRRPTGSAAQSPSSCRLAGCVLLRVRDERLMRDGIDTLDLGHERVEVDFPATRPGPENLDGRADLQ